MADPASISGVLLRFRDRAGVRGQVQARRLRGFGCQEGASVEKQALGEEHGALWMSTEQLRMSTVSQGIQLAVLGGGGGGRISALCPPAEPTCQAVPTTLQITAALGAWNQRPGLPTVLKVVPSSRRALDFLPNLHILHLGKQAQSQGCFCGTHLSSPPPLLPNPPHHPCTDLP